MNKTDNQDPTLLDITVGEKANKHSKTTIEYVKRWHKYYGKKIKQTEGDWRI